MGEDGKILFCHVKCSQYSQTRPPRRFVERRSSIRSGDIICVSHNRFDLSHWEQVASTSLGDRSRTPNLEIELVNTEYICKESD